MMLGWKLEVLNPVRINHKVYIDWIDNSDGFPCLKISSRSINYEEHIAAAFKGIRKAIQHARAQAISASPMFVVNPPTASAMRAIVSPASRISGQDGKSTYIEGLILSGHVLTEGQKSKWNARRKTLKRENHKALEKHLVEGLTELSALKGWMRMRVHFGRLVLRRYRQAELLNSKCTFDFLCEMLRSPRVQGSIDRKYV